MVESSDKMWSTGEQNGQLIYDKGGKTTQCGNTISSTNGARKTGQPHVKR